MSETLDNALVDALLARTRSGDVLWHRTSAALVWCTWAGWRFELEWRPTGVLLLLFWREPRSDFAFRAQPNPGRLKELARETRCMPWEYADGQALQECLDDLTKEGE